MDKKNIFSKRIIKFIYNARFNLHINKQQISKIVKEKFNLSITEGYISRNISKFFRKKSMKKYSDFEINFLIKAYSKIVNKQLIINYFNVHFNKKITYNELLSLMSSNKIKAHRDLSCLRLYSKEDEIKILDCYVNKNMNMVQISKFLNIGRKGVRDVINRAKLKIKQKSDYKEYCKYVSFEKVNSPEKAYFLGLLQTDGCNIGHKSIGLSLTDKDCIEFLSNAFKIKMKTRKSRNEKHKDAYIIAFSGKERIEQMEKLGIVPNKTLTLNPPPMELIDEKYLGFIIRGIIDGDGWIEKNGNGFFICSASKNFIEWCKEILEKFFQMTNLHLKFHANDSNGIFILSSSLKSNIEILKEKIYNIPFGMMRKYNRLHGLR